jgi:hypothetical protein
MTTPALAGYLFVKCLCYLKIPHGPAVRNFQSVPVEKERESPDTTERGHKYLTTSKSHSLLGMVKYL